MSDSDALARMMHALREAASGASVGSAAYFETLADAALREAARTITIVQGPIPDKPLLVLVKGGERLKVLAQVATLAEAQAAASAYLNREGAGEVYGAEIKRVLVVA